MTPRKEMMHSRFSEQGVSPVSSWADSPGPVFLFLMQCVT
jgi:hypothetical protein